MAAADRGRSVGAPATRLAGGLGAVALLLLAGWLALADSNGGEPVVIAAIPPEPDAVAEGELPIRSTVDPESSLPGNLAEPPDAGTAVVRIIDPQAPLAEDVSIELPHAPIADLAEATEFGLLPQVAADGRRAAEAYARPAPPIGTGPGAPVRVAVVVTGLGISASGTGEAIEMLPGPVSFAFAPYGSDLQTWVDRARSAGHEVLLQLPMEPFDYPDNDPGPHTLLTNLERDDNLARLHWLLGRFTGYYGVTNHMGAKLTATPEALGPIIEELARRGLAYLDDGVSARSEAAELARAAGTHAIRADVAIGAGRTAEEIAERLGELEAIAKERGQAVAVAAALPSTLTTIADWAEGLSARGVVLVPASAITDDGTS